MMARTPHKPDYGCEGYIKKKKRKKKGAIPTHAYMRLERLKNKSFRFIFLGEAAVDRDEFINLLPDAILIDFLFDKFPRNRFNNKFGETE